MHADVGSSTKVPEYPRGYRFRRFLNWFPLGLTYAVFYMGRYNVALAGSDLSQRHGWDNATFGVVITAGMWAYAFAFLINGPLTDRLGGKRAMIIGGLGLAAVNFVMSLLVGLGPMNHVHLAWTVLFVTCMYFQSFGAVSIVKVNASWFHVGERGKFSGIFGSLIALGYQLAYGLGGFILATMGLAYVFLVPAIAVTVMILIDVFLLKDRPDQAGFPPVETHDASYGEKEDERIPFGVLLRRMFSNKVIMILAAAEFCTGFVRNGLMFWLPKLVYERWGVKPPTKADFVSMLNPANWDPVAIYGTGLFLTGIVGGLIAGYLSDVVFGSRRGPVAFLYYVGLCVALVLMSMSGSAGAVVGAGLVASFFFIGVHGLLSGTATMDFGGRKAAGTATGIIDGFVYLGSGLAGAPLGALLDAFGPNKMTYWPLALLPGALAGLILTGFLWNARPTRKAQPGAADADKRAAA